MSTTLGPPLALDRSVSVGDGTRAHLRLITPGDAAALVAFHAGLSERSKFLRYFYPHLNLSADEVAHLTQVDGLDRVALVVEHGGGLIAVGRYDRLDEPTVAEVAFVVADRFQHHGIARALLANLADRARPAGITHFTAEVLAENKAMLRVFSESGFRIQAKTEWGTVELRMAITPATDQQGTHQSSCVPPPCSA
jgi:GNAT superfamily N-acetyltransferase